MADLQERQRVEQDREKLNEMYNIKSIKEKFEVLGVSNAPLGMKEVFKSAPINIKVPPKLLEWVTLVFKEGFKYDLRAQHMYNVIKNIAIENGYGNMQIYETVNRALDDIKRERENREMQRRYADFKN